MSENGGCRCVVRGSINCDEYFRVPHIVRPGETISSFAHERRVGGKGANQAVAIVRAGAKAVFCGTVGEDGLWLKEQLESWGVDSGDLLVSKEPTGRAIIQVDQTGENSIILFPGANHSQLHEENKKHLDLYQHATHLLLQNEIHFSSTVTALESARQATTFINPSPLPSQEEIHDFPWDLIDWILVNEEETKDLYYTLTTTTTTTDKSSKPKSNPTTQVVKMSTRELVSALSDLPKFRNTNIVCTLGANGVLVFMPRFHRAKTENETPSFMYLPAAKLIGGVKDTTGAGDTFAGYFVRGIMEFGPGAEVGKEIGERDVMQVLKLCVQAAAMCVERLGTIDSIPMKEEVEERMELLKPGFSK